MNRYAVLVKATSNTEVIVEAESEEQARVQAKALVGVLRNTFVWGIEGVKVLSVRPYLWTPAQLLEFGED